MAVDGSRDLLGVLRTSHLVREVMARARRSGVSLKPAASLHAMNTGSPPFHRHVG